MQLMLFCIVDQLAALLCVNVLLALINVMSVISMSVLVNVMKTELKKSLLMVILPHRIDVVLVKIMLKMRDGF